MGRKLTKKESAALVWIIILLLIIGAVVRFFETVGFVIPAVVVSGIALIYWLYRAGQKKERLTYLKEKYQDDELVRKILRGIAGRVKLRGSFWIHWVDP